MAGIAKTRSGPIQGREKDDVLLFAGIAHAAPPAAERRFRAAWDGLR